MAHPGAEKQLEFEPPFVLLLTAFRRRRLFGSGQRWKKEAHTKDFCGGEKDGSARVVCILLL